MIVEYQHHGNIVKVQDHLKGKHRDHCLCFQGCKHFNPTDHSKNCIIAKAIYSHCKAFGIVTPVWECPHFETEDETDSEIDAATNEIVAKVYGLLKEMFYGPK